MRYAKRALIALAILQVLWIPTVSFAKVFLNGVDISDLRLKTFKNATVYLDEAGDVYITAPGIKVEVIEENAKFSEPESQSDVQGGANSLLRNRYFLATKPTIGGRAQYDLVIKVNGAVKKIIRTGSPSVIMEVSAWLKKGRNKIEVMATKNLEGGRQSESSEDKLLLLIGAGREVENIVKMDVVEISFECDATHSDDIVKTYFVNAI